jgi:hypothetical protein
VHVVVITILLLREHDQYSILFVAVVFFSMRHDNCKVLLRCLEVPFLCVQDPDADALNSLASAVGGFFTGKITGLPVEKVLS